MAVRKVSEGVNLIEIPPKNLTFTDYSEIELMQCFVETRPDLKWCQALNRWFIWTGKVWEEDRTIRICDEIREFIRGVKNSDDDAGPGIGKASVVMAVERLARAVRPYAILPEDMDSDPWLLNTPDGVIDLKSGICHNSSPKRLLTRMTSVSPGDGGDRWREFLLEITDGDDDLIGYLQRLSGYSLTGSVEAHMLALLYGTGRNGKGVFTGCLMGLMGDYAGVAPAEMLLESRVDRHPTELATLYRRRLVVTQETDEGRRWNESRVKSLTGGDPVTARYMRGDFFTFEPTHKLIIATNHKPSLRHVDEAMRSRLHLVPFTVTIPPEKRDPELGFKLRDEYPAILQWAIEGCVAYREEGLNPPSRVLAATSEYFESEDELQLWIDECCVLGDSNNESPSDLYSSWRDFCSSSGLSAGTQKTFSQKLQSAGFLSGRTREGRFYSGIGIKGKQHDIGV